MFCPSCGNQIADYSKFCRFCGTTIQAAATAPPPAPVAPPPAPVAPPPAPVAPPPAPVAPPPAPVAPPPAPVAPPPAPVVPPPAPVPPTGGKFCPNCGTAMAPGVSFCSSCGKPLQGQAPTGVDVAAVKQSAGNIITALNIAKQRLIFMAVSFLGMIAIFFPWVGAGSRNFRMSVTGLSGGVGWVTFTAFAVVIALSFLGDRKKPMNELKYAATGIALITLVYTIVTITRMADTGTYPHFGLYWLMFISLGLGALPFIKKLEQI